MAKDVIRKVEALADSAGSASSSAAPKAKARGKAAAVVKTSDKDMAAKKAAATFT